MKLLIATTNPGKVAEIKEVIGHLPLKILGLQDLNIQAEADETGNSYQENAQQKAEFYFQAAGGRIPVIAEDSGIIIDSMAEELGLHTRRWGAGEDASDQEWIDYFLQAMTSYPEPHQRKAKFVSHVCYFDGQEALHFVGETKGQITPSLEAPLYAGLPLSSCFKPDGYDKVYTALGTEEKNKISHRGKSTIQLLEYLTQMLNG